MKVSHIMNEHPKTVRPYDTLNKAAKIMWDRDCGWVPVVDEGGHVVGVVTDRDVCMAAYTRGMKLASMAVQGTMSSNVHAVHPDDPLEDALAHMRNYRVRRLPVVDDEERLVGLVSLSDLTTRAAAKKKGVSGSEIVGTLAAICQPRSAVAVA